MLNTVLVASCRLYILGAIPFRSCGQRDVDVLSREELVKVSASKNGREDGVSLDRGAPIVIQVHDGVEAFHIYQRSLRTFANQNIGADNSIMWIKNDCCQLRMIVFVMFQPPPRPS